MYCQHCGQQIPDTSVFCLKCGQKISAPDSTYRSGPVHAGSNAHRSSDPKPAAPKTTAAKAAAQADTKTPVTENVFKGFVSALVGALLGGVLVALSVWYEIGTHFVGLAPFFLIAAMYQSGAGRMSFKGAVICVALALAVPYLSVRVLLAAQGAREAGITFMTAWNLLSQAINEAGSADYLRNLMLWLYGGTALSAFLVLWSSKDELK